MNSVRLLLSTLLLALLPPTAVGQTKLTFVNGIQVATPADAWESARGMVAIVNASTNRPPAQKQSFEPEAIWNPIGFFGTEDGHWDRSQDLKEVFLLKVAEERYSQHFPSLLFPHNSPRVLDATAAQAVRAYYDDLTPGENSLDPAVGQPGQVVTDGDMARTKSAIAEIIEALKAPGRRIFVAHSQGNLLVNLAWAAYVAEVGQPAVTNARFINVGNTSRFSINGLNLTHAGDKILFADQGGAIGTDLQRLAVREGWRRTTPYCPGFALCDFGLAAPTFGDGDDYSGTNDGFEHYFLPTYLSTSRIPDRLIDQGVAFTNGATRYRDRFEDFVYAAASSLDPSTSGPSPTVSSATCTAPIVGQAMTCTVTGTNLLSTVSFTATNCSPSPMTAVAGGTGVQRQFTCAPVTAGVLVQVSYLVPEFIGPVPPVAAAVANNPPTSLPPGSFDLTFAGTGWIVPQNGFSGAQALALSADGGIVVGGYGLIKYRPDGTLDPTFGVLGVAGTSGLVAALAIDSQGRLLVVENESGGSAIARYSSTGQPDITFGQGGRVSTNVSYAAIVLDTLGRVLVAGSTTGAIPDFAVARLSTSGVPDASFGAGGAIITSVGASTYDNANAIAIDSQGRIAVGGSTYNGTSAFAVMRYTPIGQLDPSFGTNGIVVTQFDTVSSAGVASVLIDSSDRIIAAGTAAIYGNFALARYTNTGQLDPGFGIGGKTNVGIVGYDQIYAATLDGQGRILVGGWAKPYCNCNSAALTRFTQNGALDTAFGTAGTVLTNINTYNTVKAIKVDSAGKIVVAGDASIDRGDLNTISRSYIARFNP